MRYLVILGALLLGGSLQAQIVQVAGVDSNLYSGSLQGGTVNLFMPGMYGTQGSETSFSYGVAGSESILGFGEKIQTGVGLLEGGDQIIPVTVPTDFSSTGYSIPMRGGGFDRKMGAVGDADNSEVYFYTGRTIELFGFPNVQGGQQTGDVLAVVGYRRTMDDGGLTLYSLNIFSARTTALGSASWNVRPWLTLAGTIGLSSGSPYESALAVVKMSKLNARVSYSLGKDTRLLQTPALLLISSSGLNASGSYQLTPWLNASGSHTNFTTYGFPSTLVNSVGLSEKASWFTFQESAFRGSSGAASSITGEQAGVFAAFDRVTLNAVYSVSTSTSGRIGLLLDSATVHITPKISASVFAVTSGGRTSVNFGGSYAGSRFAVSSGYAVEFFPESPQKPFAPVLTASITMHLKDSNVGFQTIETPNEHLRWTATGGDYIYGPYKGGSISAEMDGGGKYLVSGVVADVDGNPVAGLALIFTDAKGHSNIVWTDMQGKFQAHEKKRQDYSVQINDENSMTQARYVAAKIPATVTPGTPVNIVVRRKIT